MNNCLKRWGKSASRSCNNLRGVAFGLFSIILLILLLACEIEKQPVKVGFSGSLTGRYSDLGTAGRNGVTLAIEEINAAGGIDGRPVELITRDDQQNPETAVKVDKELIQEGVVAIIGHMISTPTMAALPLINEKNILMISPTASSGKLSGRNDWFFRVCGADLEAKHKLAEYAFSKAGMRKIIAIYDLDNRVYSEDYVAVFKSRFETLGGNITTTESFSAGKTEHFNSIFQKLTSSSCDGVLIAANALDTAMICQRIKAINPNLPILSSAWAMTNEFIYNAGNTAKDVVFAWFFDWDSNQETYVKFKNSFVSRFGDEPDYAGLFAYETAWLLFTALSKNSDPRMLGETILKTRTFRGTQGDYEIDEFGDARRRVFLVTVDNGRFKTLE